MRRGCRVQAEPLGGGTSQPVAIKALSLRGLRGDWKALELFQREAKTLEALQHPGIPKYLEYFEVDTPRDKGFYLVQVRHNKDASVSAAP
jgi:serine/threonine protein kinase